MRVHLADNAVDLLPDGGCILPAERLLCIADLHLGRGAALQAHGIAAPDAGAVELERLLAHPALARVERLAILGDLFHAPAAVPETLAERLRSWVEAIPVPVSLVRGNHDPQSLEAIGGVEGLHEESMLVLPSGIELHHAPPAESRAAAVVCGHRHPRVRVGRRASVRAFELSEGVLVLPAWGRHTGGVAVRPDRRRRIFACDGTSVTEIVR